MKNVVRIVALLSLTACTKQNVEHTASSIATTQTTRLLSQLDTLDSQTVEQAAQLKLASAAYDSLLLEAIDLSRRLKAPLPIYSEPLGPGGMHFSPVKPR